MAWQGPAAGLHQTGTRRFEASHGVARPFLESAPALLAFASLGWGLADRGVPVALKLCWCVVVFGGVSFKFLRWHIDQALAWPGFAAGLAEIGRACLGFAWGLGQAVQRVAHDMHGLAGPSCMGTSFDDVGAALSSFELEWQCIGIAGVCVCVCRCRGVCVCTIPMQAHGQLHGHIDRCVGGRAGMDATKFGPAMAPHGWPQETHCKCSGIVLNMRCVVQELDAVIGHNRAVDT